MCNALENRPGIQQVLYYAGCFCCMATVHFFRCYYLVAKLCPTLCNPTDYSGVGHHLLLHALVPTQGLNLGLSHYGRFFTTEPLGKPVHVLARDQNSQMPAVLPPTPLSCLFPVSSLGANLPQQPASWGRLLPPHQGFFPLILLPLLLRLALQPTSSPSGFKQVALFCFSSPSVASYSFSPFPHLFLLLFFFHFYLPAHPPYVLLLKQFRR